MANIDPQQVGVVKEAIDLVIKVQELMRTATKLSGELDQKVGIMTETQVAAYMALKLISISEPTEGTTKHNGD